MTADAGAKTGRERPRGRRRAAFSAIFLALAASILAAIFFGGLRLGGSRAAEPTAAAEGPLEARDLAVAVEARRTRITLALDRPAPVRVFTLAAPPRLVVDLPATRFGAGADRGAVGGLVVASHRGEASGKRARMVFDLAESVRIVEATLLDDGGVHLVVDLERASAEEMRASTPRLVGAVATTAAIGPVGKGDRLAPARTAPVATAAPPPAAAKPVIVVDPGHGGVDVGTRSPATGTFEKTVVLAMAETMIRALEATGRYDVRSTRRTDVFVPLGQRVAFAREAKADLLLSIHADAEFDHSVRGATIYTVSEKPSDAQAAALAAKENAADALAGHVVAEERDEVGDILAELTLRETRRFSLIAARDILEEYRRHGRLVKGEAHRQAGLKVLRAHDVPSVLVEIGFLSNKDDEALMTSQPWREATAKSLVSAIDRFFADRGVPGAARAAEAARKGEANGERAPASP
ncbi:MAG: N-acetylmuramoyl-L-alanine amidase [Hyphomicrobiales bacterium]|nr:N-acetylmuramoyl-L-alanine amidase [Hyphomicrobiales bacterium]